MARFEFRDPIMLLGEANAEIDRLERRLVAANELARKARDVVSPVCRSTTEAVLKAREAAIPGLAEALRDFYGGSAGGQA